MKQMGVRVTTRVDEAVEGADVIMMLRIQLERMQGGYFPSLREYFTTFGMTEARVKRAKPDVDHHAPGPDQSRRRDRVGSGGRRGVGDSRSGRERCRGANGGSLSSWRVGADR